MIPKNLVISKVYLQDQQGKVYLQDQQGKVYLQDQQD